MSTSSFTPTVPSAPSNRRLGRFRRSQRLKRAVAVLALPGLVAGAFAVEQAVTADPDGAAAGPLTVDESGHWFEYADSGEPYFMAGSGGPEGFLYYSDQRKQEIVDDLIEHDVRAIYIHAVRSNGGDGGGDENPFVGNDPAAGVDPAVLDAWDAYLSQLDAAGIVTWFHLYDDGARPFGACNPDLPAAEQTFVKTLVERFRDYQHLVWLPTEEHIIKACSDNSKDVEKAEALAAEIRKHDDVHPVGVHHNNGQTNQYLGNDDIDVFSQQVCQQSRFTSVDGLHTAGEFGEDVYVMAECHPWHKDLLDAGDRTTLRQSFWASVMAGGYVLFYDAWESTDPTEDMLADLGRINAFMDTTRFDLTVPADQLAAAGTKWVLAGVANDVYIAYSNENPSTMGVAGMSAGTYDLGWFDPVTGKRIEQRVAVGAGTNVFAVPGGLGDEIAVSIEPADGSPTTTTVPAPTTTPPTTTPPTTPSTSAPPTSTVPTGSASLVAAIEDAYLQGATAVNDVRLRVEGGSRTRTSYVRFDTSGVAEASSVRLELTVSDDPGAGTLIVSSGTGGDWTGATLSTATAPTPNGVIAATTGSFDTGDTVVLDLPAGVIGGDVLDLVIELDGAGSNDVAFSSVEGGDGPTLVIEQADAPATTVPTTTVPEVTTTAPTTSPTTTSPPTTVPDSPMATVTFEGTDDPVPNPERGFHEGVSVADSTKDSTTSVASMRSMYEDGIRLARMYVRLDDYRNGPLDVGLLSDLDDVFARAREGGIKLIPRFTYNFGSAPDASVDRIEQHLDQLTPVLQANDDVIAVLQAGFIGAWGEWHSSSNGLTNPTDRARVRDALFDALPASRMAQFRYPDDLIELEPSALGTDGAFTGSDHARTAHKNDCFLANEHDAGTYIPLSRKAEFQAYLGAMTEFTVMGGETCQVSAPNQRTDCATALDELERFHWDYLNLGFYGNTIDSWRANGCFDEIERRLGYRYRMLDAASATTVQPGGRLAIGLAVTNEGFGKLYNARPLNIVLVDDATGERVRIEHSADARGVLPRPGATDRLDLSVTVPVGLPAGTYSVHVELPDGSASLVDDPRYSVRMANASTWVAAGGSNDLQLDVTVGADAPVATAPPGTPVPPATTPPATAPPAPGDASLSPVADAYVENGTGVDGSELRVEAGARERVTHLRFDTAGLPAGADAQLRLTVGSDAGAGVVSVHAGVGGSWSGGVPTPGAEPAAGELLAQRPGTFESGDTMLIELPPGVADGSVLELIVTIDGAGSDDVSFVAGPGPQGPMLLIG